MRKHTSGRSSARNGSVLIVVLVCLGFAATVLFGALRTSLHQRRQLRHEHDAIQTEWLLDAGVRLSIEKLSNDKSYVGQTATFEEGFRDGQAGVVKIVVSKLQNDGEGQTVHVTANLERQYAKFDMQRSISFHLPMTTRFPAPKN